MHIISFFFLYKFKSFIYEQVLNKHLSLASNASQNPMNSGLWGHMLISTNIFNKTIFTVSGIDMSVFIDQWVRTGGHAKFTCTFVFNRKR